MKKNKALKKSIKRQLKLVKNIIHLIAKYCNDLEVFNKSFDFYFGIGYNEITLNNILEQNNDNHWDYKSFGNNYSLSFDGGASFYDIRTSEGRAAVYAYCLKIIDNCQNIEEVEVAKKILPLMFLTSEILEGNNWHIEKIIEERKKLNLPLY